MVSWLTAPAELLRGTRADRRTEIGPLITRWSYQVKSSSGFHLQGVGLLLVSLDFCVCVFLQLEAFLTNARSTGMSIDPVLMRYFGDSAIAPKQLSYLSLGMLALLLL